MFLNCKNCGGKLLFDSDTDAVACEYCGTTQSLKSIISGEDNYIFENNNYVSSVIKKYAKARSVMENDDENHLTWAAETFESISDVFDSKVLSNKCREKAVCLKKEKTYCNAVECMFSGDVEKIRLAINLFQTIFDYQDSTNKIEQCKPLLEKAHQEQERQIKLKKIQEAKIRAKKRRKMFFVILGVVLIALAVLVFDYAKYSKSNIDISIEPSEENYFTTKGDKYVFYYDVQIENNGLSDIKNIEVNITIDDQNEKSLVNTDVNFYNYSSVLRSKKKSIFTWELTVYSDRVAKELYEADFEDLIIVIDIVRVEYENGKVREYK